MPKTNKERQAEFREKMRLEGKQAFTTWATPEQVKQFQFILAGHFLTSLQITKQTPITTQPLFVTKIGRQASLPSIPKKAPASIARDLQEMAKVLEKKRAQISKLESDAAAIERQYRQSVEECKRL